MPAPRLLALLALATPGLAAAQSIPFLPHVYVGVEGGQGKRDTFGGRDKSADYGAFAGVELPSMPFGYLAVEGNVGKSNADTIGLGGRGETAFTLRTKADWNWSATARAGLNIIPGLATYGLAGYGAEKVDVIGGTASSAVTSKDRENRDGLIYGLGARYTFGSYLGARLEYRRRLTSGSYDPEQVMAGVYFRL